MCAVGVPPETELHLETDGTWNVMLTTEIIIL